MLWTLYGYILREMIKLLVVATLVLLCVLCFAVAIKPLSDGLFDAVGVVKFVAYSAPTFLQFVLPFAGAFASTMVFHRMVNDNEIVACTSSGISYHAILGPVIVLGLAMAGGLFVLSNWVVPVFYKKTESLVQKDLISLMVTKVRRGEAVDDIGNWMLYADDAAEVAPPAEMLRRDPAPQKLVILTGVALSDRTPEGRLGFDGTAERADMLVYEIEGHTWVVLELNQVDYHDSDQKRFSHSVKAEFGPHHIPRLLSDDVKFFSWPKLSLLRNQPDQYDDIRMIKRKLARAIAVDDLVRIIFAKLTNQEDDPVLLQGPADGWKYQVMAPNVEREGSKIELIGTVDQPVEVKYFVDGQVIQRYEAKHAVMDIKTDEISCEPKIHLQLGQVHVFDSYQSDHRNKKKTFLLNDNVWPIAIQDPLFERSSDDLLVQASDKVYMGVQSIRSSARRLANRRDELLRKIIGEIHKRAAFSMGCLLTLVLGAVLSMTLRMTMPLFIYFCNFLMTTFVVIMTYSSKNIFADTSYPLAVGIGMTWLGCVAMGIVMAWVYARLAKH